MRTVGTDWLIPVRNLAANAPIYVAAPAQELIDDVENTFVSPRVPLFALCTFIEALLRFLTLMRIAEIAAFNAPLGTLPPHIAGELRQAIQAPTFGQWRSMLQQVVQLGKSRSLLMPELAATNVSMQALFAGNAGRTHSLIGLRNALAHGGSISSGLARSELDHWGPACVPVFLACAWLSEVSLFGGDPRGVNNLNGARGGGVSVDAVPVPPCSIVACRGENRISLTPFGRMAPVRDGSPSVVQGFVRRGTTSLVYATLHSDDAMQAEGDWKVLKAFERLFDQAAVRASTRISASNAPAFEADMAREAAGFIGRAAELQTLWDAVTRLQDGVLWVEGVAGAGKSALMARLATDLALEFEEAARRGTARQVILAYRFRSGQGFCHGGAFLAWLIERLHLATSAGCKPVSPAEPLGKLRAEAGRALADHGADRVVILLDGLDELARNEPSFWAQTLPHLVKAANGTLFVCSGRPDAGLAQLMRRPEIAATIVFQGGLPRMGEPDLRAFLDARLRHASARMIRNDLGDDAPQNEFMAMVSERSEGLPIYLELVAQDIGRGRFTRLDASDAARLPDRVQDYFAKLVTEARWGDDLVYQGLAGMMVVLAHAPIGIETIADLLRRDGFDAGEQQREIVRSALANLGGLLRERITTDLERGYDVFHTELRDYVKGLPSSAVRQKVQTLLATQSLRPQGDAAAPYLYRFGVGHLTQIGRPGDAMRMLSSLEYQVNRLACLERQGGDADLRRDWFRLAREGAASTEPARSWSRFWTIEGALMRRGIARVAARELLERCLEYAPDTEMGAAVDVYVAQRSLPTDNIDQSDMSQRAPPVRPLLEVAAASRTKRLGSCVAVLADHNMMVRGALEMACGKLLSWGDDGTVRSWTADGQADAVFEGHTSSVLGALELSRGRILSWSGDKTLRLWNVGGLASTVLEGHSGPVCGALVIPAMGVRSWTRGDAGRRILTLSSGRTLSCDEGVQIRLWTLDGRLSLELDNEASLPSAVHELGDDFIVSWGDGHVTLYEADGHQSSVWFQFGHKQFIRNSRIKEMRLRGHFIKLEGKGCIPELEIYVPSILEGVVELTDGSILSWHRDHKLRRWASDGRLSQVLEGHWDDIRGSIELTSGRLLSWSMDGTLRLWDAPSLEAQIIEADTPLVTEANVMSSGNILACYNAFGYRGYPLHLWDCNGELYNILDDRDSAIESVHAMQLSDGRILSTEGQRLRLWSSDGKPGPVLQGHTGYVAGMLELADGYLLSWSSALHLWSPSGDPGPILRGHTAMVKGAVEALDGRIISFASESNVLQSWRDDATPGPLFEGHPGAVEGCISLGDGRLLSWGQQESLLRLWNANASPGPVLVGHRSAVRGAVALPNGSVLSWSFDHTLRLWTAGEKCCAVFEGHTAWVQGGIILSDGRVASWSADRTLRLWNVDGTPLTCVPIDAGILGVREIGSTLRIAAERSNRLIVFDVDLFAA